MFCVLGLSITSDISAILWKVGDVRLTQDQSDQPALRENSVMLGESFAETVGAVCLAGWGPCAARGLGVVCVGLGACGPRHTDLGPRPALS